MLSPQSLTPPTPIREVPTTTAQKSTVEIEQTYERRWAQVRSWIRELPSKIRAALLSQSGKRCIAEFIGTYMLVFTIGCNACVNLPSTAANWSHTSIACALMVSVYALGGVSGAHFNPAVSLALAMAGKIGCYEGFKYSVTQMIAGVFGGVSYHLLFYHRGHASLAIGPQEPYSWFEAMNAEILYTCMLCFVVLNVSTALKLQGNHFYGLAIGFVIVAAGHAVGGISGAILNPAVAFGVEISSGHFSWSVLYMMYEFLGAVVASGLFSYVRPDDHGALPELSGVYNYGLEEMCVSEIIGTFYLFTTMGLCVLNNSPATPWASAAALMSMVFSLDTVSGAHFNPVLTLVFMLHDREGLPPLKAVLYVMMQMFASLSAAVFCKIIHLDGSFAFGPGVHAVYGWGPVIITEITYTFMLCYVVLSVSKGEHLKEFHGLAIGSCVTASGFAAGAVSGASLNPALSLSSTMVHLLHGGTILNGMAFVILELLGGILAFYAFKATRTMPQKSLESQKSLQ